MIGLCTLTVNSWTGALPMPGEYVMSPRGRTAFLIVEFVRTRPGSKTVGRLRCERCARASVPAEATIHLWRWAER